VSGTTAGQAGVDPASTAYRVHVCAFNALTEWLVTDARFVPLSVRHNIATAVVGAVEPLIRADERALAAQEPHTTGAHADGVRLSDYLREKGNDYAADMIERAERAAIAAREPHAADGLRAALEAQIRLWRHEAELTGDEDGMDVTAAGAVDVCANELATILAAHPEAATAAVETEQVRLARADRDRFADGLDFERKRVIVLKALVAEMLPVFAHTAGGNYSALVPGNVLDNWRERAELAGLD
jgi:hypothetical protein